GYDAPYPGPRPDTRPSPAPPEPDADARPPAHRGGLARPLPRPPRRHADRDWQALRRGDPPPRPRERPPRACAADHRDAAARAGARCPGALGGSRRADPGALVGRLV